MKIKRKQLNFDQILDAYNNYHATPKKSFEAFKIIPVLKIIASEIKSTKNKITVFDFFLIKQRTALFALPNLSPPTIFENDF